MTNPVRFIHLRVHTEHSLLEGAVPVKKLVKLVAGAGMLALSAVKGAKKAAALETAERTRVKREAGPVRWNFHKYLISRDGRQVLSFGSQIAPESKVMTEAIEQMLKSTP